jgi:hypothetical protein
MLVSIYYLGWVEVSSGEEWHHTGGWRGKDNSVQIKLFKGKIFDCFVLKWISFVF